MVISKKKSSTKHCGFMDKPCMKKDCALYYVRFDRCSVELMPDNLYFLREALSQSTEASTLMAEQLEALTNKIDSDAQTELF